jgi:hypothetical protein
MKKKLLFGLLGAAGSIGLASSMVSCSDNYSPTTDMEGKFIVSLNLDKDVVTSASNKQSASESRAAAQSVSASDLSLKLTSESGSYTHEWAKASDLSDSGETVPVGKYKLEAYYGSLEDEGFEKPYYYGSSSLTIEENRTTPISVSASLANSMVRVELSDAFTGYFADYKISLRSEQGNEIEYGKEETRSVYLAPGSITATIEITKQNGTTATLEPKSFTAEARHSYVLKFDVNGGEVGDGVLVLTYDEMVDVENVEIDLSDAILNAPAPRLTTDGFTSGESWSQVQSVASSHSPKVTAIAQAGIDGVILTSNSAYLQSLGIPKELDLVSGDATAIAQLKDLGLVTRGTTSGKTDKMAYVDFSGLLTNLQYVDGGDNTSEFSVQVRDKNSRIAETPVGFSVTIEQATLSIASVSPLLEYETALEFNVATNLDASKLQVELKNERGVYAVCSSTYTDVSGQTGVYHVVATVPSCATDIDVRVSIGTLQKTFTVEHSAAPYSLTSVENGTFSWQAAVDIAVIDGASAAKKRTKRKASVSADPSSVAFEVSTDNGGSWKSVTATKLSTARYLIKDLAAGTTYRVRATCDGYYSKALTIKTEAAGEQPYNCDMEEWYSVTGDQTYAGTCYWTRDYPGKTTNTIWGTMNLLTTSNTSSTYAGCAYGNYSGTRQSTDANTKDGHAGKSAAIIQTVGWGANTAPALSGRMGTCKNVTPGELYLGSYNSSTQSADYGIAYTGRPSSLEFYYKYTAKNSADYGYAFIKVLDASGNVLAEKSQNLTAASSYTKVTFDLASLYAIPCNAAATLQIGFKSSANSACLEANTTNLSIPGMWNLSDGRYTGSSLYIDDIKLNF